MRCKPAWPIILAGAMALPAAAQSLTCTWKGTCTTWDDPDGWSCGRVPGSDDNVVIPAVPAPLGCYPEVSIDTTIRSLTVQDGGLLGFDDNVTLTVTHTVHVRSGGVIDIYGSGAKLSIGGTDGLDIDADGVVEVDANGAELELTAATSTGHDIDGSLFLKNSSAFIDIQQHTKFIGDGKVEGQNDSAQIIIASGKILSNAMSAAAGDGFRGHMVIKGASDGNGTFTNNGLVYAENGTIELDSTLAGVSGSGKWEVASSTDKLRFEEAATGLTGAIVLAGELEMGAGIDVKTCGELTFNTGAAIDVNSSTFKYQSFNAGSDCSNPKDAGTGADCDTSIFVVSSDKICS